MRLYFLRHGIADWPGWERPDDERPLNRNGQKQMRRVASALAGFKIRPAVILSSPLPRAAQTAAIVAEALGLSATETPALAPGFDAAALRAILQTHAEQDVLLVGHEPDFSAMVKALTGGDVVLKKAAIACVAVTDAGVPRGELLWLVTPKFLR